MILLFSGICKVLDLLKRKLDCHLLLLNSINRYIYCCLQPTHLGPGIPSWCPTGCMTISSSSPPRGGPGSCKCTPPSYVQTQWDRHYSRSCKCTPLPLIKSTLICASYCVIEWVHYWPHYGKAYMLVLDTTKKLQLYLASILLSS